MNVLITGGAGYIGSELSGFLLNSGHTVRVVDNLEYEPDSLLRYIGHDNFDFDKLDVRRKDILEKYVDEADVIIPLAALVGFPLCAERERDSVEVNYK